MGRKSLSLQEVKSYFEKLGYKLLSDEYENNRTKITIMCPNGHIMETTLGNFKQRNESCVVCMKEMNKKEMYENIKKFIESEEYELLSDSYENAQGYLNFMCPIGHLFQMSWNNFQRNHRCPYCANRRVAEKLSLSESFIKNYVEEQGYEYVSTFREKRKLKIEIICPKGHKYITPFNNFKQGYRCRKCAGSQRFTNEEIKEIIEKEGYKLLSTDYKNAYSNVILQCPEGHIYTTKFHNFKYGNVRCHYCHNASKGERKIIDWLNKNNVKYIYDKPYFDDLLSLSGNPLRPDFIIEHKKIWIEYDGEFHYKDFYEDGSFEKMQIYDKLKNDYAKKNEWKLIRIPYWEFNNIEKILEKEVEIND